MKKVAVIMGSDSDLPIVEKCIEELKKYEIPTEVHVYSAHRTPDEAIGFAKAAEEMALALSFRLQVRRHISVECSQRTQFCR